MGTVIEKIYKAKRLRVKSESYFHKLLTKNMLTFANTFTFQTEHNLFVFNHLLAISNLTFRSSCSTTVEQLNT